jgi:cellulose synthase/poly-beta-1,6-N-acetylglucosamine synthase-like glycosyltransferase
MELWVVIPAYNEAVSEIIERTVDELERAGIDYEVLVVDDASEDETLRWCRGSASGARGYGAPGRIFRTGSSTRFVLVLTCTAGMRWRS